MSTTEPNGPTRKPRGLILMDAETHAAVLPESERRRLSALADVDTALAIDDFDDPRAAEPLRRAEFLITGWGTPVVTPEVLARAPKLAFIAHAAGSLKHHLGPHVWDAGVTVSTAADVLAGFVAEYTLSMIHLTMKGVLRQARRYRLDGWPTAAGRLGPARPTIGVVGASRIGRIVLSGLAGSVPTVLYDPYCSPDTADALGTRLVDLDELCASVDVLSVHAPQLPETRHLIDGRLLGLLRDGATVINTARGSIIDTDALVAECASGRLDAILDVTDPEPLPAGHPLFGLSNVIVTPHVAGAQGYEMAALGAYAVTEVARFFAGSRPLGLISADELPTQA
ncbi:hydroxyacid dehydrogenase [Stackebrandtia soli]|uniref:hydroxyacid dehydrogenase n=1 Tax=Stackebrandtia soli TaxID=1892856 RepID=UPI0039EBCF58